MADKKDIHKFALKYYGLYMNPQTTEDEVKKGFARRCLALGFKAGSENRFAEAFSLEAFYKKKALDKVINDIEDVELLGSAIFSHWEYATRGPGYSSPLEAEHRRWFITAFARLAIISEEPGESTFIFEGRLQKIQLVSNNICCGANPSPEDEVEQRLTITADGQVWLSRYRFGSGERDYELIEKQNFNISDGVCDKIMATAVGFFGKKYDVVFDTDAGSWFLTLTNAEGKTYRTTGALCHEKQASLAYLSDLLRLCLGRDELFAFDGNPDYVVRIEIKYHRNPKMEFAVIPEEMSWEYVTWDYNESLTIDRDTETLKYIRKIGSGFKMANTIYAEGAITNLLDSVDINALKEVKGNPPDALDDPMEARAYEITTFTKRGAKRVITGTFDKNELPVDWPDFIKDVFNFMLFYGYGELFDEKIYKKAKRRKSDRVFCNVMFDNSGRTYCYLADSDEYCEGDLVVVPVGPDNHEEVVKIASIEYHPASEAPFPIGKIKRVLRKYNDDEPYPLGN